MNKIFWNKVLFFCFLFSIVNKIYAQERIDSDQFFSKVISQFNLSPNTINSQGQTFSWIEGVDIRTETRDFNFNEQEYTLRVSPSTPRKRKAQKALLQAYSEQPQVLLADQQKQTVIELYSDWISLYLINKELDGLGQLQEIYSDRQKIYNRKLAALEIDFDELVSLKLDENDLTIQTYKLNALKSELLKKYTISDSKLNFDNLISYETLLGKIDESVIVNNGEQLVYNQKQNLIARELELERAEQRQILDFAQLRYRGPHENLIRERVSLGLGITIPNDGNRKLKIARLMQEQQELEDEFLLDAADSKMKHEELVVELKRRILLANFVSDITLEENKQLSEIQLSIEAIEGFDPLLVLKIKEELVKRSFEQLEHEEDILYEYLKVLISNGLIFKTPFTNYLKA